MTMRRFASWAFTLWLLGTAGCEQAPLALDHADHALSIGIVPGPGTGWSPSVHLSMANSREDLATGEVIGLVPLDSKCPEPSPSSGWKGGELFSGVKVSPEPPLKGVFCAYAKLTGSASYQSLPGRCVRTATSACASTTPPDSWLEPVPRHLRALGLTDEARDEIAEALRDRFETLLAAPASLPGLSGLRAPWNPLPAGVTVWALDNGSAHARAVEQTVRAAACLHGSCSVIVEPQSIFGDESLPASALRFTREVFRITQLAVSSRTRTLINASVGFPAELLSEPSVPGRTPQPYLAYEALKAAINHAGCQGVGFVAAIGNRTGGPSEDEGAPMFPGGWSDGKSGWKCDGSQLREPGRPLMLAAGAINGDGRDSATTRRNAQAELVAPGYAVPRDVESDSLYWEGSSFASAALAGVIASAWSYMPHASLQAAYGVVRKSALELPERTTRLCHDRESCNVKRIRLCHAIQMALDETARASGDARVAQLRDDMGCGNIERLPWATAQVDEASRQELERDLQAPAWESAAPLPSEVHCQASARMPAGQSRAPYSCPFELFGNGAERRAALQTTPPGSRCPHCTIIIIDPEHLYVVGQLVRGPGEIITAPALRLTTAPVVLSGAEGLHELSGLLDAEGRFNVRLDASVSQYSSVEAVLEYALGEAGQELAQADPIPVIDLYGMP
jgi:hypothetical protein